MEMTFNFTVVCTSPLFEWKRNVAVCGPTDRPLVLAVTIMGSLEPFVPITELLFDNVSQFVFEPSIVAVQSRLAPPWLLNVTWSFTVLPTATEPKLSAVGLTTS